MTSRIRDVIVRLALSARGIPYIWGGATPAHGLDCSGFVVWLLQTAGVLHSGDWTAQALTNVFGPPSPALHNEHITGNLAVYGGNRLDITHIMMTTGDNQVTGASGGNRKTTTRAAAEQIGAQVLNHDLHYRKDLVGILAIPYPDE